jgi:predicted nucleic acid-binding Zn ribbon protein
MTRKHYDTLFYLLKKVCRQHGIAFYPDLVQFTALWKKTMGPYILRNTEVHRFQKGIAWIRTPSPTWRFELTQMKPQLIDRLNREAGHPFVKDLKIEIGNVTTTVADAEPIGRAPLPQESLRLPEDEAAWIKRCVSEISDSDLRRCSEKILTRFLIRSLNSTRKT